MFSYPIITIGKNNIGVKTMVTLSTINRLVKVLERNITQVNPTLDYNRLTQAKILLGQSCQKYQADTEVLV